MANGIKGIKRYINNSADLVSLIEHNTLEDLRQMLHTKICSKQQVRDLSTIILNGATLHDINVYRRLCAAREAEFSIDDYYKYIDNRSKYAYNSLDGFKLLYGSDLGEKKYREKYQRRGSAYNVDVVMRRHKVTKEEAEDKIAKLKSRTSGNINRYIAKFGVEAGTMRFNEFVAKSINTLDNFRKWYGDEAEAKWQVYTKSKDCSSLKYFISKYGDTEGSIKFKQKIDKSRNNLDRFIKKYNGNVDLAEQKYAEMISKRMHYHKAGSASKESLLLLKPIMDYLDSIDIKYRVGVTPNKEMYLWSTIYKRSFFYDFVIPDLKYIIEFDGCSHAPIEDAHNWRCPYRGISQEEARLMDQRKDETAKLAGYSIDRIYYINFHRDRTACIDKFITNIEKLINENKKNNSK